MSQHTPVMLKEVLEALCVSRGNQYADVTYGGGGYSKAIYDVSQVPVIASDRDQGAFELGNEDSCVTIRHARFTDLSFEQESLDGLVADLGLSSIQLADPDRGFSFKSEGPLDMRMGLSDESVQDLLMRISESDLIEILRDYGEEPNARAVAKAILKVRPKTTLELAEVVSGKTRHFKRHPATRTFQALRIAVNQELEELQTLAERVWGWLKIGGRFVVVSFHSLEDRIVKRAMKSWKKTGLIKPSLQEIERNPRARSAKLRWCEK